MRGTGYEAVVLHCEYPVTKFGKGKLKYIGKGKQKYIGNGKQKCIPEGKQKYTIES